MLETNKIIHFVSYFARVHGFEEERREPKARGREGKRRKRRRRSRYGILIFGVLI